MDISSVYTNMYLEQAKTSSGKAIDKSLNKDYAAATEAELMDACKDFEAYFVEQMFKAMEATTKIPGNDDDKDASVTATMDMFGDQLQQEYAKQAIENQDFGIAQALFEQMKRNYGL